MNRVHVDDRAFALEAWRALERGLGAHLEAEERDMLPLLDAQAPAEAAGIRAEHAEIRRQLGEIGVGLEIHVVCEEVVERFARALRDHAAREDALLYRWAEGALDEEHKQSILERLARARSDRAEAA